MSVKSAKRACVILLGWLYALAFVAAAPFAYAGALWIGVSERGWQTQIAAASLVVGWLALAVGAVSVWRVARRGERTLWRSVVPAGGVAVGAYAIAFSWGGRMLI
jgi:hypothetical protein